MNKYKYNVQTLKDASISEKAYDDFYCGLDNRGRLCIPVNFLQSLGLSKLSMVYVAANVVDKEKVILISSLLPLQLGFTGKSKFIHNVRVDKDNNLRIANGVLKEAGFLDRFYRIDVRKKYIVIFEA